MTRTIAATLAMTLAAGTAVAGESVTYEVGEMTFEGYYAEPEGDSRGLVVIVHDWDGLGDYEQRRTDMLADLGYSAFALDIYGAGNRPETTEASREASGALYADRETMRERLLGGLAQARAMDGGEAVVIGYCFGGAAALELARSQEAEDVEGYVSFHGGLATPEGQSWEGVDTPLLIAHGGADQAVPMADVAQLVRELEAAGTPYEVEIYAGAPHSFTEFGSDSYREDADQKSWAAFQTFLEEHLG